MQINSWNNQNVVNGNQATATQPVTPNQGRKDVTPQNDSLDLESLMQTLPATSHARLNNPYAKYAYRIRDGRLIGPLVKTLRHKLPKAAQLVRLDTIEYRNEPQDGMKNAAVNIAFVNYAGNTVFRVHFARGTRQGDDIQHLTYRPDEVKAQDAENWAQTFFHTNFDNIASLLQSPTLQQDPFQFLVFHYQTFDSMTPSIAYDPIPETLVNSGKVMKIIGVREQSTRIQLALEYVDENGQKLTLPSNFNFYFQTASGSNMKDAVKYNRVQQRLQRLFNLGFQTIIDQPETVIGKRVSVNIKKYGTSIYCEIGTVIPDE